MTELIDRLDTGNNLSKYGPQRFYSDRLKWISIGLFIVALFFKNRHWPFSGILMIATGSFSILLIIGQLIEGVKYKNHVKIIFGVSIGLSIIYLVFRFQYWYGGSLILGLAILTGFSATIYLGIKQRKREVNNFAMSLICVGAFLFTFPRSKVWYYTNMSKVLNKWDHNNSVYAWNRYGTFLKEEGKVKEAEIAYTIAFKHSLSQ